MWLSGCGQVVNISFNPQPTPKNKNLTGKILFMGNVTLTISNGKKCELYLDRHVLFFKMSFICMFVIYICY